jgi:hypothetical protein
MRAKAFYSIDTCRLTLLVSLVLVLTHCPTTTADDIGSPGSAVSMKRGVSCGGRAAGPMNAGWYYSWYIDPGPQVSAEFVPMIAHGKDANSWYFDRIMALKKSGKAKCLLGFNEPERKFPGGEISVDAAIAKWPMFEQTGLRLGSPAPAMDDKGRQWLDDFMTKAQARHLRVDFIALHWYGDVADPQAAKKFAAWLTDFHDRYQRPVWITEFAGLNWGWLHHPITAAMNQKFLTDLEPSLEQAPWIERYCWFSSEPANLFTDPGQTIISPLGRIYADGGQ